MTAYEGSVTLDDPYRTWHFLRFLRGGGTGAVSVMVNPAVALSPISLNFGSQVLQSSVTRNLLV